MSGLREAAAQGRAGIVRPRALLSRLVLFAVAVLLIGQIAVAWFALVGFERELSPQLNQKAQAVGRALTDQITFAVRDLGIPPRELVGVEPFFDEVLAANPDIEYLAILEPSAEPLFARGPPPDELARILPRLSDGGEEDGPAGYIDGAFRIESGDGVSAALHVGVSRRYVRSRLSEILFEVITVIAITWLVTLEFMMFFVGARVTEPLRHFEAALADGTRGLFANRLALRTRDEIGQVIAGFNRLLRNLGQRYEDFRFEAQEVKNGQIDEDIAGRVQAVCDRVDDRYQFTGGRELRPRNAAQIRIPLFLFIFSEELSRSFLPLFVARHSVADAGFSAEFLIGLPITLFMLAAAIVTPIGGVLADRFGARRIFLAGIVPAVAGYVGTSLTQGYYDLVVWRIVTGLGYGLIFIAAQAWVAENTDARSRAQGMAVFVGAVFVGAICGPSIGGIFADRIGFEATFLIGAVLAVVSGLMVYFVLDATETAPTQRRTAPGARAWRPLLFDLRFIAVSVFAAVPGKLILTGFFFFLVPLYLSEAGNNQATIGWIMMLYGGATIACTSLASRFADRSGRYAAIIAAGGALAGLGCLAALFESALGGPVEAVIVAILALGGGHALSLTSQLAIIQEVAERHRNVVGQATVIGAYRMIERAGLVIGPIAAAAFAAGFGYRGAMIGIGVVVLASVGLYAVLMSVAKGAPSLQGSQTA